MNKKINLFIRLIADELGLLLSISFGIFLFVLFFQPFPVDAFNFNNGLVFISGFSGIVFVFMSLIRVTSGYLFQNTDNKNYELIFPPYLGGFIILALTSVAFSFYLHFVGSISISFFIVFKIVLICLAPPVILNFYDRVNKLKQLNGVLIIENKIKQKQIEKYEEDSLNKSIDFISENSSESLNLLLADLVLIKSADNYVEIVYYEGESLKKKLIRNTMKNIEQQIKQYTNFIRCHRICIVNTHYIEKMNRSFNKYSLTISGYNEEIPVSRQYLEKLKETI